jgi:hypothetical protein
MRGRKPRPMVLSAEDASVLHRIARCRQVPWYRIQRARILLGMAAGQRVHELAEGVQCDPATIWRVCRRYEAAGLEGVLSEAPRLGRPQAISPPPAGSSRGLGVPGAHRQGFAHHALEQP